MARGTRARGHTGTRWQGTHGHTVAINITVSVSMQSCVCSKDAAQAKFSCAWLTIAAYCRSLLSKQSAGPASAGPRLWWQGIRDRTASLPVPMHNCVCYALTWVRKSVRRRQADASTLPCPQHRRPEGRDEGGQNKAVSVCSNVAAYHLWRLAEAGPCLAGETGVMRSLALLVSCECHIVLLMLLPWTTAYHL